MTSTILADPQIKEIKTLIDQALESKDMNHENWFKVAELLNPLLIVKNPDAIHYSSFLHAYGVGGYSRDIEKAVELERTAAESGSVAAMLSHARRYEYGLSGHIEISKSIFWYKKAGNSGSRTAASRMETAYRNGELGLGKNINLANKWKEIKGNCKTP
jgi:TPR repeat protein